jgi:chromosomal replication initiation ATPase DnaA
MMREIVGFVCGFYETEVDELLSYSRRAGLIWPRHVIMAIAAANGFTSATIAEALNRERTLVSYAHRSVQGQCDVYPLVAKEVKGLAAHIKENIINK